MSNAPRVHCALESHARLPRMFFSMAATLVQNSCSQLFCSSPNRCRASLSNASFAHFLWRSAVFRLTAIPAEVTLSARPAKSFAEATDSDTVTLCLVSATGSAPVTLRLTPPMLCPTSTLASHLGSALAKKSPVNPLESALANLLDLKSLRMNTYRKWGPPPILYLLPFALCVLRPPSLPFPIFVCSSAFISVHLWLHLLPFLPASCLLATSLADRAYLCLG